MVFLGHPVVYNVHSMYSLIQLVLHPHGIAPAFLELEDFIPIISTKGIDQKKVKCYAYKKI